MSDCLTCAKFADCDGQPLAIGENKEVQNAVCKHFWFGEQQYQKSVICRPCWRKIEDFHRFYCEVEELHSQQLYPHVQLLEIKQENVLHDLAPELDECRETEGYGDVFEGVQPSDDVVDSESEDADLKGSARVTRKRARLRSDELTEVQQYVSQNLILDCDTCSQRCTTFDDLQRHSMMEHAKKATVLCCKHKFTSSHRFVDHIRFHLDPNQFKCSQCFKLFGNRESLNRHARKAHASNLEDPAGGDKKNEQFEGGEVKNEQFVEGDIKNEQPVGGYMKNEQDMEDDRSEEVEGESSEDDDEDYEQDSDNSEESNRDNDDDDDDDDDEKNSSGDDGEKNDTRKRTRASTDDSVKIEEYVSKNMTLECDTCSKRCSSFKELQKHSMREHGKRSIILCCDRKLSVCYRFEDHILYHLNPDRFKCSHCSDTLSNREALRKHILKVHTPEDERLYHCTGCFKKFARKNDMLRHAKTHKKPDANEEGATKKRRSQARSIIDNEKLIAENINLECDTCRKKWDTFSKLQKHSLAEHQRAAYVFCCGYKFNKKPRLIDHVLFHLDPTRFQCKICHRNLRHSESLKRHMEGNHAPVEAPMLKCSMCPKTFTSQRVLKMHERYHNRSWLCEICDKRFICEAILTQHHKSVHTKELNYVCHVCAKTFHIYSSYRSHLETHDESVKKKPQKPRVQCTICNVWTLKLTRHMRLHSGTRTCEICGKECKNSVSFRYHMKNHETGDYMCSVCGKGFKKDITLKEHMASHTGDVLYSCDFCDRTFNSNANRAAHRKKMHPQQWLEAKMKKEAARLAQFSEPTQS